ncbi:MAG: hypothetical protein GY856_55365 [bacterium]|nr:hypothetical protein [bacterium]
MLRKFLILIACLTLLASLGCRPGTQEEATGAAEEAADQELEKTFKAMSEAYDDAETAEEKVRLLRDFLDRHPDTEYTGYALHHAIADMTGELNDPEGAYELVRTVLAEVEDPERQFKVKIRLAVLHGKTGKLDELRTLLAELAAEREFDYYDHLGIIETAVEAEAWDLVLEQSEASLALATPEAFKADYPDMEDEKKIERYGKSRRGISLAHQGWALVNLERSDEGLATFREAQESITYSYVGFAETPLYRYWARTLLQDGDVDGAIELVTRDALYSRESEGRDLLRQAYVAKNGSDEGFDGFLWNHRLELARTFDSFSLPNYDDETVDLGDFKGDVMLLAFWFPT